MSSYPIIDGHDPYVDDVFNTIFPQHIPGYEARPQQVKLSKAIDAALRFDKQLLAEAATGTGKTYSYLIPAIRIAREMQRKVVICTANIALQEQIVNKDLPKLKSLLPFDFNFALLKGRNNYFCPSRAEEEKHSNDPLGDEALIDQMDAIEEWSAGTSTGDVSELDFVPKSEVWSRVCGSSEDCESARCRETECFSIMARGKASKADVIVTNYHMLYSDAKVRMNNPNRRPDSGLIPDYHYIICDEGHEMADIARDFFGFRLGLFTFYRLAKQLRRLNEGGMADKLNDAARKYFKALGVYAKSPEYKARIKRKGVCKDQALELNGWIDNANSVFEFAANDAAEADDDKPEYRKLVSKMRSCEAATTSIKDATGLHNDNAVYYLETERDNTYLCSKLIDASPLIKSTIWDGVKSAIVTSATLATSGSFNFIKKQLALPNALECQVESPFDYSNQALMVVPGMTNLPTDSDYPREVANAFYEVIVAAKGRTLGLFTSYRILNTVVGHLRARKLDFDLLVQGEMPRTKLVNAFRDNKHSVLLGVSSLWTGVDVQGESLSCLAIDRMPFPNPTDPVIDAICERNPKGWFFDESIPRAVITFRQGFGRLIRSKTDTGVIVMFDRRIVDKPYGKQFVKSLPNIQFSRDIADVEKFIVLCDQERVDRAAGLVA